MSIIQFDTARELDVIPIGRICLDFNPVEYFKPWPQCDNFKKYVGGSPANIAVGMARLGCRVGFIGCISDDQMGDFCTQVFLEEGIDVSGIVRARHGESMGLAFTEVVSKDQCGLIMYRDQVSDLQLEPSDVSEAYIRKAKMIVVSGTALSASPSREAVLKAVCYGKKHGTVIVFDIDYRPYTWKNDDEIAIYYTLVAQEADIIMGSREEFDRTDRLLGREMTDEEIAGRWFGERAKIVVIKHGKQGSTAHVKDAGAYSIRPFPVNAVKSTGGGDGYGSAFLNGLLRGWDIRKCLEYGSASASMLVASHGCSPDMPTEDAITAFIAREKAEYGEEAAVWRVPDGSRLCPAPEKQPVRRP